MRELAAAYGTPQAEPPSRDTRGGAVARPRHARQVRRLAGARRRADRRRERAALVRLPRRQHHAGDHHLRRAAARGSPARDGRRRAPRRRPARLRRLRPARLRASPAVPRRPRLTRPQRRGRAGLGVRFDQHQPRSRPAPRAARCGRTRAPAARRRRRGSTATSRPTASRAPPAAPRQPARARARTPRPAPSRRGACRADDAERRQHRRARRARSPVRTTWIRARSTSIVATSVPIAIDQRAGGDATAPASTCRRSGMAARTAAPRRSRPRRTARRSARRAAAARRSRAPSAAKRAPRPAVGAGQRRRDRATERADQAAGEERVQQQRDARRRRPPPATIVRAPNGESRSTSTSVATLGEPSSRAPSIVWPSAPLHHAQAGATTTTRDDRHDRPDRDDGERAPRVRSQRPPEPAVAPTPGIGR